MIIAGPRATPLTGTGRMIMAIMGMMHTGLVHMSMVLWDMHMPCRKTSALPLRSGQG